MFIFLFQNELTCLSKVCYLFSCVLLKTIIVLLDDKLLSPPSLMSSTVHSSHHENGLHQKKIEPQINAILRGKQMQTVKQG